jgi:hypothetical protein
VSETLDDLTADSAAVKLRPRLTGLPMAVWITEDDGYPHDVRVKVPMIHSGGGACRSLVSVGVRPHPREIVRLSIADFALVRRWIELNRDVIIYGEVTGLLPEDG